MLLWHRLITRCSIISPQNRRCLHAIARFDSSSWRGRKKSFPTSKKNAWKSSTWRLASNDNAQAALSTSPVSEPTTRQLLVVALRSAIPMVGFGFMDNLVMIQAGEAIDLSLGVTFGLSTLTAAGFGQCFSDVAGFTCGGIVDATVARINLPKHGLSQAQLDMRAARIAHTAGGCVGVVCGCLIGMCSLLFMDTDKAERLKKAKELTSIFRTVMQDGHKIVRAERCSLWMHDSKRGEVWSRVATGTKGKILRLADTAGVVGACVQGQDIINIHDAYKDRRFSPKIDKETGYRTRSIIAVPVKDDNGRLIGVIEMVNKKNEDGTDGVFDVNDAKLMLMLSSHVSAFIKIVSGSDNVL